MKWEHSVENWRDTAEDRNTIRMEGNQSSTEAYSTSPAVSASQKMVTLGCHGAALYGFLASFAAALVVTRAALRMAPEELAAVLAEGVYAIVMVLPFSVAGTSGTAVPAWLAAVDTRDAPDAHTWPKGSSESAASSFPVPTAKLQPAPSHEASASDVPLVPAVIHGNFPVSVAAAAVYAEAQVYLEPG